MIAVIDSTILKIFAYGAVNLPTSSNVILFVFLSMSYGICGNFLIMTVNKNSTNSAHKSPLNIRIIRAIAFITQNLTVGIILIVIVQMILLNKYNLNFLHVSTFLTHTSTLLFVILIVFLFLSWVRSKVNRVVLLYMASFILICFSVFISLIYLEYNYSLTLRMDRKAFPIYEYIIRQEATPFSESLYVVFDILYFFSFVTIWVATAALLSQYRSKIGKAKYFALISIPLIYYSLTFEGYFSNVFSSFALSSPIAIGVVYALTFSATKQVGALLFSLSFLTASKLVTNERVRKSLMMSGIGIAIIFGSVEITTLQYRLYPPFGLVTEAFMPLGAYLLFIGIFTSATNIANDAQLRENFYRSAMSQLNLLKTIGVRQMEIEILKKFRTTQKRTRELELGLETYPEEEDVQQIVRDVLNEVYSKRVKTEKSDI